MNSQMMCEERRSRKSPVANSAVCVPHLSTDVFHGGDQGYEE